MSDRQNSGWTRFAVFSAAAFLLALIFVGGAQPGAAGLFVPPVDKVVHAGVFGLLAWLFWVGFNRRGAGAIFILVVLVGLMDEGHQLMLPGRDADWLDLMADFSAAAVVLVLLKPDGERRSLWRF